MKKKLALEDDQVVEVIALHASGCSSAEIARKMGVHPTTIANVCRGLTYKHIPRPEGFTYATAGVRLTDEDAQDIINMWNGGEHSVDEISAKYNVSNSCIYNVCKGRTFRHLGGAKHQKKRVFKESVTSKVVEFLKTDDAVGLTTKEVADMLETSIGIVYAAKAQLSRIRAGA